MPKYELTLYYSGYFKREIEAKSEEQAWEISNKMGITEEEEKELLSDLDFMTVDCEEVPGLG